MINKKLISVFLFAFFISGFLGKVYALDTDKIKVYFLQGNYKAVISEDSAIKASGNGELVYLLGISYLKDARYPEAAGILEQLAQGAKDAKVREEAKFSLGDVYLLSGQELRAKEYYEEFLKNNPATKFKAQVYSRLGKVSYKGPAVPVSVSSGYYTVQVGSFSSMDNANSLSEKLIQSGYPAYLEQSSSDGKQSWRVRVGKLNTLQEALTLEKKLSSEGYPTKICP